MEFAILLAQKLFFRIKKALLQNSLFATELLT